MGMDTLQAQITNEIGRMVPIVEELTGLPSRWNGTVEIVPLTDFFGKKLFSCSIQIADTAAASEARWRTLIHELLHSVSAGYNTL